MMFRETSHIAFAFWIALIYYHLGVLQIELNIAPYCLKYYLCVKLSLLRVCGKVLNSSITAQIITNMQNLT